ncbi:conserved hypothetical protein [Xylella fastidiosa M12]|nr:conserved hypothetical protein [Xylella fastidiosa M12]
MLSCFLENHPKKVVVEMRSTPPMTELRQIEDPFQPL